jgi:hypothetical protein
MRDLAPGAAGGEGSVPEDLSSRSPVTAQCNSAPVDLSSRLPVVGQCKSAARTPSTQLPEQLHESMPDRRPLTVVLARVIIASIPLRGRQYSAELEVDCQVVLPVREVARSCSRKEMR